MMIMKQKYTKWIYFLAIATGLQWASCTGSDESLELLNGGTQSSSTDSRATEPVTAHVTLTDTDRLEAKLAEALGDAAPTVQKLTISGTFNAIDVEFLHTLTALQSLDMTGAVVKSHNEHSHYSFTCSYVNPDGYTVEVNVNNYLSEKTIGYQMFAGMTSLKEFKIPAAINSIEWHAFEGCTSLEAISLPSNIKSMNRPFAYSGLTTLTIEEGITSISNLGECHRLKTVNLPSTLKEIGPYAFENCPSLESITIPDGVVKIGSWAFGNTRLTSVRLPDALKEIGEYAFNGTLLAKIEIPASVTTLGNRVFANCKQLRTLTIPETVTQTEGSLFDYCSNLTGVFWNSEAEVGDPQGVNENCFLYLQTKNNSVPYWGPNWVNVIIDGVAKSIELKYDISSWRGSENIFACPQAFKAKSISVDIHFDTQWTYQNVSSVWRTLALPFTPTHISHAEKGRLAPFGSDIEGAKPFWLRRLTQEGFTDVTSIEPNIPYIIAMPYNPDIYIDEYNISGTVTFKATDAEIEATPQELLPDEGPDYYLQPTYRRVAANDEIYVLNRNWWAEGGQYEGSVFTNTASQDVYCFEAYVKPKPGTPTRSAYAIDTRSANTRSVSQKNTTGIPAIGDM